METILAIRLLRSGTPKYHVLTIVRAGFTPSGAPVQKKMWGPLIYEYPVTPHPRLPSPDTHSSHHRHFVEDSCCFIPILNHYFNISGLLTCCKKNKKIICFFVGGPLLWGPLFGRTCWTCLNLPLTMVAVRTMVEPWLNHVNEPRFDRWWTMVFRVQKVSHVALSTSL